MQNTIPAYQTLMPNVFIVIQKLGGKATNDEILDGIMKEFSFPEEYKAEVKERLKWSRTYLKKYGFINNLRRATWTINEGYLKLDSYEAKESIKKVHKENIK